MNDDEVEMEDGTVIESDDDRNGDEDAEDGSENAEDDQEDQDDDEEDEDDDDDDEEEDEDDGDGEEDEDDDDEEMEDGDGQSRRRASESSPKRSSPNKYIRAIQKRRAALFASSDASWNAQSYTIDPVGAAPHGAHVHAMALSGDGTSLLSGGVDGHIRKYDVYASMNGKAMLTQNVRHQFVDGVNRAGVLSAWWANEEVPQVKGEDGFEEEEEHYVSAVHSLAIQQESLWGLSGTESGNINLYSLRHDVGQLRHVLRRHTAAVSAMALSNDDTELISGGWDRCVHQWDLNTGQVVRSFPGHSGQISSLSLRPIQLGQKVDDLDRQSPRISIRASALSKSPGRRMSRDVSDSGHSFHTPSRRDGVSVDISPMKGSPAKTPSKQQAAIASAIRSEVADSGSRKSTPGAAIKRDGEDEGTPSKGAKDASPSRDQIERTDDSTAASLKPAGDDTPAVNGKQNDSFFGGDGANDDVDLERDLNEALGLGIEGNDQDKAGDGMVGLDEGEEEMEGPDKPTKAKAVEKEKAKDVDSDGDSLFGAESADGDADADGEADADADADADGEADGDADGEADADADAEGEEEDADGEDDDAPLAARLTAKPAASSLNMLELPGSNGSKATSPATQNGVNGKAAESAAAPRPRKTLPKPAFGGADAAATFDGDVSKFSNDILLTTTLGGQVTLWDKRVPSYPGDSAGQGSSSSSSSSTHKGVRALALPEKTPPWCMSACWNSRGDKIYVGRRNETVDEWDLRMLPDSDGTAAPSTTSTFRKGNARFARHFRLPPGSGPVTAVAAMPNGRHIVCGSYDNVRLWDTQSLEGKVPFRIVAGHHGATVSQIIVDPTCRFLFTSSGDRGWLSTTTETVLLHEIQTL